MALRLFKIAIVYLLIGVSMGVYMATTHDFTDRPIHVHANLLGWSTLALAGVFYYAFPAMTRSWLAAAHFWLHNVGLPLGLIGIALILRNHAAIGGPIAGVGSLLALLAFICLAINLWRNASLNGEHG
jgi:hypothetical protein